jgi:hypothetical protein
VQNAFLGFGARRPFNLQQFASRVSIDALCSILGAVSVCARARLTAERARGWKLAMSVCFFRVGGPGTLGPPWRCGHRLQRGQRPRRVCCSLRSLNRWPCTRCARRSACPATLSRKFLPRMLAYAVKLRLDLNRCRGWASLAKVVYPGNSTDLLQAAGFDCRLEGRQSVGACASRG